MFLKNDLAIIVNLIIGKPTNTTDLPHISFNYVQKYLEVQIRRRDNLSSNLRSSNFYLQFT